MSIVIVYTNKDDILMSSDNRGIHDNGAIETNFIKSFKRNNYVIGFLGSYKIVEALILNDFISNYDNGTLHEMTQRLFDDLYNKIEYDFTILISGFEGDIGYLSVINSNHDRVFEQYIGEGIDGYHFIGCESDSQKILYKRLAEELEFEEYKTINSFEILHEKLIKFASTIDVTIDKNITHHKLLKSFPSNQ